MFRGIHGMGDGGHPELGNPVVRGTEVTLGLEEPMFWGTKVTLGMRDPMVALDLEVPVMWGMEVTLELGDPIVCRLTSPQSWRIP